MSIGEVAFPLACTSTAPLSAGFAASVRVCEARSCLPVTVEHQTVHTYGVRSTATQRNVYLHHCNSELLGHDGVYCMMAGDHVNCKVWWQHALEDVLAQSTLQAMQGLGWPCILTMSL